MLVLTQATVSDFSWSFVKPKRNSLALSWLLPEFFLSSHRPFKPAVGSCTFTDLAVAIWIIPDFSLHFIFRTNWVQLNCSSACSCVKWTLMEIEIKVTDGISTLSFSLPLLFTSVWGQDGKVLYPPLPPPRNCCEQVFWARTKTDCFKSATKDILVHLS